MDEIQTVKAEDRSMTGFIYGLGPTIRALNAVAEEIARTDIFVLILGESGTGKDAYARLIHRLSPYGNSHLSKIDCTALAPDDLLAHVNEAKRACSNLESPGNVYLDNIQELDLVGQRVLLSQLPDAESVDRKDRAIARFISASTRDLKSEVASGRFRRELYFRLNGACLRLPLLRERVEDIPVLAEYFLNKHSTAMKKQAPLLNNRAVQALMTYHWPGNIRELENLVRKIVVLGDVQIALNELRSSSIATNKPAVVAPGASLKVAARAASKSAERELIMQALERTRWNRKQAARALQISYKSLLYKIKQMEAFPGERESGGGED
jgi:DNA-binding NtrC family response regulator